MKVETLFFWLIVTIMHIKCQIQREIRIFEMPLITLSMNDVATVNLCDHLNLKGTTDLSIKDNLAGKSITLHPPFSENMIP
jgi:hypothetical protein